MLDLLKQDTLLTMIIALQQVPLQFILAWAHFNGSVGVPPKAPREYIGVISFDKQVEYQRASTTIASMVSTRNWHSWPRISMLYKTKARS